MTTQELEEVRTDTVNQANGANANGSAKPIITPPAPEYLPKQDSQQVSERWQSVQATFVDDPRKSVSEAHKLVSDLMERIVQTFSDERGDLEKQWSKGGDVSTEDLRVCLQRYRTFFSRLLPLEHGAEH
jgi:hypothetical protein